MDIELVSSLGPEEGSGSKNVACYSNKHDNTELQITPFNTKGEPGLKHNLQNKKFNEDSKTEENSVKIEVLSFIWVFH